MSVRRRTLWIAGVLAPLAWLLDLEASYAVAAYACGLGPGPRALLWLAPLVALGASVVAGTIAWRGWTDRRPAAAAEKWPPDGFLAACGLATSAFFILVIVVQAVPTLILRACDR